MDDSSWFQHKWQIVIIKHFSKEVMSRIMLMHFQWIIVKVTHNYAQASIIMKETVLQFNQVFCKSIVVCVGRAVHLGDTEKFPTIGNYRRD